MKLRELEPHLVRWEAAKPDSFRYVRSLKRANGLLFVCPKCLRERGKRAGVHSILCWSPDVPQTVSPTPGRWNLVGTSLDDLSLVAGSSSVLLLSGCKWHGFITDGEVRDA
jgi:hypothetical protein